MWPAGLRAAQMARLGAHRKMGWKTCSVKGNLARVSTLTIQLDDEAARQVAEAARAANQPLEHWLRASIQQVAAQTVGSAKAAVGRISPLHPGAMQTAPDFNAPLEEFAPYV